LQRQEDISRYAKLIELGVSFGWHDSARTVWGEGSLLATNAGPISERERLTGLLDVAALGVKPALWFEDRRFVEVAGIVGDRPRTGVDFCLFERVNNRVLTTASKDTVSILPLAPNSRQSHIHVIHAGNPVIRVDEFVGPR